MSIDMMNAKIKELRELKRMESPRRFRRFH